MIDTIILDLDGTLIDPADGVIAAYQHTLRQLGLAAPEREQLLWVIGPPTRQNLVTLLGPRHDIDHVLTRFRAYYDPDGFHRTRVYAGIGDALRQLRALPVRLFVCTARPRRSAEQILTHLGLVRSIDRVYGAEDDGRFEDKAELLAHLLSREGVAAQAALMVGDRASDAAAAAANAIRTLAVGWGYGGRDELTASDAVAICNEPRTLVATIRRVMGEAAAA